jgi:hypothetical protein
MVVLAPIAVPVPASAAGRPAFAATPKQTTNAKRAD